MITESNTGILLSGPARLFEDDRDVAWAERSVKQNPALRWVLGKYVEADRPNNNNQMWTLPDLRESIATVINSPMNMLHQSRRIVGHYTDVELLYPTTDGAQDASNPYVEALGAFYKWYFPEELALIEKAHAEGSLYFSMECISKTIVCAGENGCGSEFAYAGPRDESYCNHINDGGVKLLAKPHFLAGAILVPPVKPGWSNAEIHSLVANHSDELEAAYRGVKIELPHLSEAELEGLMFEIVSLAKRLR